jgi:hypothetical protein
MADIRTPLRTLAGLLHGVIGGLIMFGVSLALSWRLASSSPSLKLIGLYFSSGVAVLAGGFIFTWRGRIGGVVLPAIAGFLLGGYSAVYILGPTLPALGLATCATVIASFGALLYHRLDSDRRSSREG